MAEEASRSGGSADSYIGSLISLTSKYEIRYEGVLHNINTEESSIGLTNVRSFGTEGRKKDGPQVPPSDKTYEYILFRGSDIKDLQVKSSPPVQNTQVMHNDPAIIQSHYSHPPAVSTSFPPAVSGPVADLTSHTTQMGHPGSSFQGGMPLHQAGGLGSWGSSPHPPSVNANGLAMPPMYWQGFYAPSSGLPQVHQQSLLQPPAGMSMPHSMQQPMQYPSMNASLSGGSSNLPTSLATPNFPTTSLANPNFPTTSLATPNFPVSNLPELPPSLLPSGGGRSNLTSTAPSTFPLTVPSTALASEKSSTLPPNKAPTAVSSTATLNTSLPLVSPLTTPILDVNAIAPPTADKPKTVTGSAFADQTVSQAMSTIAGTSSSAHAEISGRSLVTPSQLLQPGSTTVSSSVSQEPAHKDVEVIPASSSDPPRAPAESQAAILPLPSAPERKLNGAPMHYHHNNNNNYSYRGRGRGGRRNGVSPPVTKFTEDFDFIAMNEKFNKDEVWDDLGKSKKGQLRDKEGDDNEDDEDYSQYEDETESSKVESKPTYVKDDFFDSLSSNAIDREQQYGRTKFSEQRKIDTETFGNFPRHRGGRGGRGPPRGGGGRFRGSYYGGGRDYGSGGRDYGGGRGYGGGGRDYGGGGRDYGGGSRDYGGGGRDYGGGGGGRDYGGGRGYGGGYMGRGRGQSQAMPPNRDY